MAALRLIEMFGSQRCAKEAHVRGCAARRRAKRCMWNGRAEGSDGWAKGTNGPRGAKDRTMEIKDAGFSTPGSATLPPSPHVTPDTLRQDLNQFFGPRGYKTALLGANVVLKKSYWMWVAISILHEPQSTTLRFLTRPTQSLLVVPSVVAGLGVTTVWAIRMGMGLGGLGRIPLTLIAMLVGITLVLIAWIIAYFNAGKPLLAEFRGYLEQSPLLHRQPQEYGYGVPEKDAQKAAPRKATRAAKKKAQAEKEAPSAEKAPVEKRADEDEDEGGGAS